MKELAYKTLKVQELPASEIEIEAEVPAEVFEAERAKTIAALNKEIKIDGFRSGHIPEKVIVERVGEMGILEHSAEKILPEVTYQIVVAQKIDSIGRPGITITKIAKGEPVTFKIRTAVFPKIAAMPDYKKIAHESLSKEEEKVVIDEKEYENLVLELRRSRLLQDRVKNQKDPKEDVGKAPEEHELPVFDDAFVKALGDFKDVNDFKEKVMENMKREKEYKAKEKRRLEMLENIVAKTTVDLPMLLIDNELEKMWAQFNDDVARMGLTVDHYLSHIKKTEADLRNDWKPDAEKRAKLQLVLDRIAKDENIIVSPEEIEKETKHLLEHYKDALPERARAYTEMMLTNQKVFEFLEKQK